MRRPSLSASPYSLIKRSSNTEVIHSIPWCVPIYINVFFPSPSVTIGMLRPKTDSPKTTIAAKDKAAGAPDIRTNSVTQNPTTNEKLGEIGNGLAIQAHASILLRKKQPTKKELRSPLTLLFCINLLANNFWFLMK